MSMRLRIAGSLAIFALGLGFATAGASGDYGSGYDTTTTSTTSTMAPSTATTVKLGHSKLGRYLVNGSGYTLYLFLKDTGKTSKCTGACAKAWPPLLTKGKPKAGSGVRASLLGTTTRSDGKVQVTYNGHPLYRYEDDVKPGQHHGQKLKEFGAKWYVVKSNGKKLS